jgi:FAD/FMN-containing dehydrogenase/Fe-S oxidoreductase
MSASRQLNLVDAGCEIRSDNLTRQLYATDASHYQIEPLGVAFPRNAAEAGSVITAAAKESIPIIPRGAGTGLVGGALGQGLVVDFSRHNRGISDLNLEKRTVHVGAGVVLDQLNSFLKPHGFRFGPDVATSSRATLGGMIANNSSGSHVPVYGTTAEHVVSLEIVLADGQILRIGRENQALLTEREQIDKVIAGHGDFIQRHMPPGLLKRWPGYGIDRWLRNPGHLCDILAGSEGTLAAIVSAEVRVVLLPKRKDVALIFFASVAEAMQATVELLELKPAAIEHIDHVVFDQTKKQLAFKGARDLMQLDAKPCESILVVEFFDDEPGKTQAVAAKNLGLRTLVLKTSAEANLVWEVRKAGLSLLTGCPGSAKPVTCIEDTVVRPEQLPAYVGGLQTLFSRLGLQASFYGHAASGLLHVRPVLDLHDADDVKKFRQLSNEVAALVKQFKGSLASEHGVGIARTEYMEEQLGPEILGVLKQIKNTFDPRNIFNPGKIIGDGRFKIDQQLRTDHRLEIPFTPVLEFAVKDHSFIGNLEQCNGCGGCRKDAPTMCPTFVATGEEVMSTRGRANIIRAALENRLVTDPLSGDELDVALSNCLSCKACTTECPSNVNMALLKAELLHARWQRDGLPLSVRMFSSVDLLGRLGSALPRLSNAMLRSTFVRNVLERWFGIIAKRPLLPYAEERFDHWFAQRYKQGPTRIEGEKSQFQSRGQVILWDDTFVRYHEPHIGKAAVKVLEAAGFEVLLVSGRKCCGRPAFSQGNLDEARHLGEQNLKLLAQGNRNAVPILFLEPSCYSMFIEDYRELGLPQAEEISKRCFLFEQFIEALLKCEPEALRFKPMGANIAIHAHCHAKALLNPTFMATLAQRLPGRNVSLLDTGCCGMAGAFGATASKYELSLKVADPLVEKISHQPPGTIVIASGTSCRHQIEHLTPVGPKHMAEVLADALD